MIEAATCVRHGVLIRGGASNANFTPNQGNVHLKLQRQGIYLIIRGTWYEVMLYSMWWCVHGVPYFFKHFCFFFRDPHPCSQEHLPQKPQQQRQQPQQHLCHSVAVTKICRPLGQTVLCWEKYQSALLHQNCVDKLSLAVSIVTDSDISAVCKSRFAGGVHFLLQSREQSSIILIFPETFSLDWHTHKVLI